MKTSIWLLIVLAFAACGESNDTETCDGISSSDVLRPNATVAAADVPFLDFRPAVVSLGTEQVSEEVRLRNLGTACLRVSDVEIVQSNAGQLAFHPGEWWFDTAEFRPLDEVEIQVRWRDVNQGQDEGAIFISTNDPGGDWGAGVYRIPLTAVRSSSASTSD